VMLIAELFELESGTDGEKRTDSPSTDPRRKEGPVAPIGRLAEQLADVSEVNRNSASKIKSVFKFTCRPPSGSVFHLERYLEESRE
jgi:hypothetical protein